MTFPVSWVEGLAVVKAPEEIDITNAGLLRAALASAVQDAPRVIVVDMSDTEFCDSTGLNALVRAQKQAGSPDTEFRLVIRSAAVRRMLNVTGVTSMFGVYRTLEEALQPG